MEGGGGGNEKVQNNSIPEKVKGIMGTFKMFCAVVNASPRGKTFLFVGGNIGTRKEIFGIQE